MMQALLAPLRELAELEEIQKEQKKEAGMLLLSNCSGSEKTHLTYGLSGEFRKKLIIRSSSEKAASTYEEYRFLSENVYLYPAKDLLFYHADIKGKYLLQKRMEVIREILNAPEDLTIITTMDAFLDGMPLLESFRKHTLEVESGQTLDLRAVEQYLAEAGYEREIQVDAPGQFAVRGGILDIYPLTDEVPVRIELWGDEVDSIRTFDPDSQRSIENLERITVYPAGDLETDGESPCSFLDYFDPEETLLFLDEPNRLAEALEEVEQEVEKSREKREEQEMHLDQELKEMIPAKEIYRRINQFYSVGFATLETRCKEFRVRGIYPLDVRRVNPYNSSFETLTRDLKRLKREKYRVVLLSGSRTRAKRLAEDLRDYDLNSFFSEDMERTVNPGEILVAYGHVAEGYEYPMLKFMVIAESDIFGRKKKKKRRKTYDGQKIQDFAELHVGDYVVHENHGIGIYQGIEKIQVEKVAKDYMKISYAAGGTLYIPATQLDMIQKYA